MLERFRVFGCEHGTSSMVETRHGELHQLAARSLIFGGGASSPFASQSTDARLLTHEHQEQAVLPLDDQVGKDRGKRSSELLALYLPAIGGLPSRIAELLLKNCPAEKRRHEADRLLVRVHAAKAAFESLVAPAARNTGCLDDLEAPLSVEETCEPCGLRRGYHYTRSISRVALSATKGTAVSS